MQWSGNHRQGAQLRRDPRATLCVFVEAFHGPWVHIEGTAQIVTLPEATEPLVDYYRRLAGEHVDDTCPGTALLLRRDG